MAREAGLIVARGASIWLVRVYLSQREPLCSRPENHREGPSCFHEGTVFSLGNRLAQRVNSAAKISVAGSFCR
jgi:hypothetical protein